MLIHCENWEKMPNSDHINFNLLCIPPSPVLVEQLSQRYYPGFLDAVSSLVYIHNLFSHAP